MTRRLPTLRAASLALALLLSLSACGGDDPDTPADGDATSDASTPADSTDEAGTDETGDAPAGGVTFVDVTDAAAVVAIGADGFEPGEASVAIGDVVQFTAADDGTYGVIVSDLDGYTVTSGIDEYFRFDEPGSYPVTEDISGSTMTVTVE